ncbi:gag polymerase env [Lasallia pustulata]|uniref:Gag polymerase env n=1 Tax=Lasallia pustulata TaxID=136370 RepID=A0A1W5CZM3_9LECA|nr:gag polymerase env [Lasallia pustulata]
MEGIFMDLERIRAVEEWLPPQDVHQLQVFLGFVNFFRRFIKNYSQIAAPLLNLLKTGNNKKEIGVKVRQVNIVPALFPLSKTALEMFKALKEAFKSTPLLRYFDENKPMRVETDASAFTIGRILTKKDTETRYGTGEQELLAIKLTEYDFNVTYQEGKKTSADSLSRRLDYKLPKASTTSTAVETVRQSFRLGSNDYKPVQEKLYTLAAMTLRPRRPVQQLRQEDVVPDTNADVNMDGGTTGTPAVRNLYAREASRNGDAVSVTYMLEKQALMVMLWYDKTTSYPTSIWTTVRLEHQQSITYMLEKQALMVMLWYDKTTLYPTSIWTAVRLEHQQSITYMLEKQAIMVMLWYNKTTSYPTSIWMSEGLGTQKPSTA